MTLIRSFPDGAITESASQQRAGSGREKMLSASGEELVGAGTGRPQESVVTGLCLSIDSLIDFPNFLDFACLFVSSRGILLYMLKRWVAFLFSP